MPLADLVFVVLVLVLLIGLFWCLECWDELPYEIDPNDKDEHEEL